MPKGLQGFQKGHGNFVIGVSRRNQIHKLTANNNKAWLGDSASYSTKHNWIRRHYGQPSTCEECGKEKLMGMKIHWANISGQYKRDRTDWRRLCVSCHFNHDQLTRKRDWHGRLI